MKQQVVITLDKEVIDYLKEKKDETGVPVSTQLNRMVLKVKGNGK